MLEASGLTRRIDGRVLFADLDLRLGAGERLVVHGPSGSGKSLLLRALAALDPVDAGTLALEGRRLEEWGGPAWRAEIAYIHQTPPVHPGTPATLWEALSGLAAQHGRRHGDPEAIALTLGLDRAAWSREWSLLSGGERQRAALALAVAMRPRVLLLDEPTAALDEASREAAETVLLEHAAVWVTHDAAQAARVGGDVVRLEGP